MTADETERQTRRDSLLVLLSRAQRGVLSRAEASLLRAHVEVELDEADEQRTETAEQHRCALAAVLARPSETPFAELTEYAADALTRSGERLLAAERKLSDSETLGHKLLQRAERAEERAEAASRVGTRYLGRAERAEATLARSRALARRIPAGSPQGTAAVYAERIKQEQQR
ncbi:hypothetical protein [Streptomyces iconiensis]|uniref:Uncharacterized protein n=1 Tax=Streptomyces iconiensis TaxID=1384038 RepID=A0ABT7A4K2_9ACTN|nr:hypothetical protein [Streptomyces iconiensis]MDJ1136236.1 hypothetical protein [Streptomyces iconiensis]